MNIHPEARTTPKIRAEIQASKLGVKALAKKYNISVSTVRKWKSRQAVEDRSHCPHHLQTTLSAAQELLVVELRKTCLLPLDDLLVIVREFIHPAASRSALHRCLKRHDVSDLKAMLRALHPEKPVEKKKFKDYEPGYIHVDIKYLPKMVDEKSHQYLFVAIDRATRWVYFELLPNKRAKTARGFVERLIEQAAFTITTILTDNGKEFTDKFCAAGQREPTGKHEFDVACQAADIEHRLIKPRTPQTNGMVERFNGRISEILNSTHFESSWDLKQVLTNYLTIYNHHIPQKSLDHTTPIEALKSWQQKKPELFKKRVYHLTGPDMYKLHRPYKLSI